MKYLCFLLLLLVFLFSLKNVYSFTPLVNLQINVDLLEEDKLLLIIEELEKREFKATIYANFQFASKNLRILNRVAKLGYEIALYGFNFEEKQRSLSYEEQGDFLLNFIRLFSGCGICGFSIPIIGFKFYDFYQNEDIYKVLDELGILYISGEGMKYSSEHENDPFPFLLEGYNFYIVPISSIYFSECKRKIYLYDKFAKLELNFNPFQWLKVLEERLNISLKDNIPMTFVISDSITGSYEGYFKVFCYFLDRLREIGVRTITTKELVTMYLQ
jgi:hypothetical protein